MTIQSYVNCVLLCEDKKECCIILKQFGPPHLINKINFLGGKVKPDEDLNSAVVRETKEESGLNILGFPIYHLSRLSNVPEDIDNNNYNIDNDSTDNNNQFILDNLMILIPNSILRQAFTADKEQVSIISVEKLLLDLKEQPNKYAHDFKNILDKALAIN